MDPTQSTEAGRPNPSSEVLEKPVRRRFTVEYKARILAEADACTEPGALGELLWRGQRSIDDAVRRRFRRRAIAPHVGNRGHSTQQNTGRCSTCCIQNASSTNRRRRSTRPTRNGSSTGDRIRWRCPRPSGSIRPIRHRTPTKKGFRKPSVPRSPIRLCHNTHPRTPEGCLKKSRGWPWAKRCCTRS